MRGSTKRAGPIVAAASAVLFLLLLPRPARAQETTFTVNPIDLVNGYFNFEIDSALAPAVSFAGGVNMLVWDGIWQHPDGDVFAVGPEVSLRFYPFLGAPAGFWLGPYAGISYVRVSKGNSSSENVGAYGGGMLGYTIIVADVLVGSVGVGLGYADLSDRVSGERLGLRGAQPRFRLAIGFAF
jgi:uncharacterized protein DUF3575